MVCASLKAKRAKHQLRFGTSSWVNNSNVQSPIAPLYCSVDVSRRHVSGLRLQFQRPVFPGFASCDGSGNSNNADARAVVRGFVPAMLAKEWCDADGSVPRMLHAQGRARLCPCPSAAHAPHASASMPPPMPAPMPMPMPTHGDAHVCDTIPWCAPLTSLRCACLGSRCRSGAATCLPLLRVPQRRRRLWLCQHGGRREPLRRQRFCGARALGGRERVWRRQLC